MGKIESAEAPGADVASMVRCLLSEFGPTLGAECVLIARKLESLSTRCTALEGVIAEHNKRCERECDSRLFGSLPRRYLIEEAK